MREMKDSGVEWIGEIPKDWKVQRNKRVMQKVKEIRKKYSGEDVLSLTINGVITRDLDNPYGKMPTTFDGYQFVQNGNLLMCLFDIDVTPRCVGLIKKDGVTSPAYSQFSMRKNNYAPYYYYYYLYLDYKKTLLHLAKNLRHSFTEEQLGELCTIVPPIKEQKRIAAYLDSKCSKIDSIIEKQQAIIEKLKEYKLSVITEAVTKGLNPDAPMKDSGVEWIGEIPNHWSLGKAKYYIKITNGSEPVTDGLIPVYGSGSKSFKTCGEYKDGPCVLLGRKGATLHIPHYIEGKYWNVDTAFDVKVIKNINLKFYYYLACCFDYKLYISQTTLPGMTQTNYGNMRLPVPNLDEQESIVEYIDNKTDLIDILIEKKKAYVIKLQEYKKSLIYEVVTGKKEV